MANDRHAVRLRLTFICAGLLSVQVVLLLHIGWAMSITPTEVGHLGATVYWWHSFANDVYCANPPLTHVVSGLPVVLTGAAYDGSGYSALPYDRPEWPMGRAFLDQNSMATNRWCVALARWSLIPFVSLGGYFGWRLSRELYGDASSLVFLALWCFSPWILGWGGTMCPDVTAASLGILSIYTLRQWLRKPTWTNVAVAGACLGLANLSKLTWLIAFAVWPFIWLLWTFPHSRVPKSPAGSAGSFGQMLAVLCIGLYVVNVGYMFEGTLRPLKDYVFVSSLLRGEPLADVGHEPATGNRFDDTWLGNLPVPLPAAHVQGIDIQRYDFEKGRWSYLRGEWRTKGWWYYYLYALAVKTPTGVWLLLVMSVVYAVTSCSASANWRDELIILVPMVAVLVLVSSQAGFSAHPRYVIPILPFLFIWISNIARVFQMSFDIRISAALRATVIIGVVWAVGSSMSVYPHSLSYYNELVGGPANGPKHLLGSATDWGQDLFYLEDWCGRNPEARPLYVAYRGGYRLDDTAIESAGLPPSMAASHGANGGTKTLLKPGWYALSVNDVYGHEDDYQYFQRLHPEAMAGYSIYIYEVGRTKLRKSGNGFHQKSNTVSAIDRPPSLIH